MTTVNLDDLSPGHRALVLAMIQVLRESSGSGALADPGLPTPSGNRLLRIPEAAERLAVSRSTMYQLIQSGQVPSIRVGRSRRIAESALSDWIRRQAEY